MEIIREMEREGNGKGRGRERERKGEERAREQVPLPLGGFLAQHQYVLPLLRSCRSTMKPVVPSRVEISPSVAHSRGFGHFLRQDLPLFLLKLQRSCGVALPHKDCVYEHVYVMTSYTMKRERLGERRGVR